VNRRHHILVTNDDGFDAPGIKTLASAVTGFGDLTVIAPESERSGASHAITAFEPIVARQADISCNGDVFSGYKVSGTPTDCVRLGVLELLDEKPDFIVSGVNRGGNYGGDILYSGTVGAALEAALFRIPAIAFSLQFDKDSNKQRWDTCEKVIPVIVEYFLHNRLPGGIIINVNIPNLPIEDIKGIRRAKLSSAVMDDQYIVNNDSNGDISFKLKFSGRHELLGRPGEDYNLVHEGYVTLTPLHFDMTYNPQFDDVETAAIELEKLI